METVYNYKISELGTFNHYAVGKLQRQPSFDKKLL
jgi:hypothetical protein